LTLRFPTDALGFFPISGFARRNATGDRFDSLEVLSVPEVLPWGRRCRNSTTGFGFSHTPGLFNG
jgi:hypothetical protein